MKKLWYYSLLLGMMICTPAFVACGGDDDDTPSTKQDQTPTTKKSMVGTWKVSHVGDNGLRKDETLIFNQDNTYERDWVEVEFSWIGAEKVLTHYETVVKGTYTYKDGTLKVKDTQSFTYDQDQKKLVDNPDFKASDEYYTVPFVECGNGILMWSHMGGIELFCPANQSIKQPSLAGNELVGRWEIRQTWIDNPDNVTVRYIEINADGTMVEGGESRHIAGNELFQASRSKGILVLLDTEMVNKLVGEVAEMELPQGVKFCSFIEDVSDYYSVYGDQFKWSDKEPRHGGHPNQYAIKNGKLYFGVIGQDEEYFFSEDNALSKVK